MTSGATGNPGGGPAAGPETSAGSGQPAGPAPNADAETGPPDDVQELQQEIEQTRAELGETVEQLVAKTDVKAKAQAKTARLASRVKGQASQARAQAAAKAGQVRGLVAGQAGGTHEQTVLLDTEAGPPASGRAAAAAAWGSVPEPVRQAVANGAGRARQHRVPLAVAAGALVAGLAVVVWWRRR